MRKAKIIANELNISDLERDFDFSTHPAAFQRYDVALRVITNSSTSTDHIIELCGNARKLIDLLWYICEQGISLGIYRDIVNSKT